MKDLNDATNDERVEVKMWEHHFFHFTRIVGIRNKYDFVQTQAAKKKCDWLTSVTQQ